MTPTPEQGEALRKFHNRAARARTQPQGDALLPCPFCGESKAGTRYIRDGRYVGCACGASAKPCFHGRLDQPSADERAIAAWNTRTPRPTATPEAGEGFLAQLRRVNADRYHAWVGDGQDAGILFDAAELGGEVGELLNVVKKLVREEAGWRGSRAAPEDFADECADVLICLDKLARRRGVDLVSATIAKFNATSDKQGFPHKLAQPTTEPRS